MQYLLKLLREIVLALQVVGANQQKQLENQDRLLNVNRQIIRHLNRIEKNMATADDVARINTKLTAVADKVTTVVTAVANVRQDIADLKAANPSVDLSSIEANVDALGGAVDSLSADATELDTENPATPTA